MSFTVAADSYDRFMGRYSVPLAPRFADLAHVVTGQRVLDVGCGPGALTTELVGRLGADGVAAVDPSEPFVAAARERHPGVQIELAPAERVALCDGEFDAALAQLVVHFMADPVAGLREMGRVTRQDGVVAASSGTTPAVGGPSARTGTRCTSSTRTWSDESRLAGAREGHLTELFEAAGIREVQETHLEVSVEHPTFEDWWEPFTLGVGPAGGYVARLDPERRVELRERCRQRLSTAPFVLTSRAWAARGRA